MTQVRRGRRSSAPGAGSSWRSSIPHRTQRASSPRGVSTSCNWSWPEQSVRHHHDQSSGPGKPGLSPPSASGTSSTVSRSPTPDATAAARLAPTAISQLSARSGQRVCRTKLPDDGISGTWKRSEYPRSIGTARPRSGHTPAIPSHRLQRTRFPSNESTEPSPPAATCDARCWESARRSGHRAST